MHKKVTLLKPRKVTYFNRTVPYLQGMIIGWVRTSTSFCVRIKQEWCEWIYNKRWFKHELPNDIPKDQITHSITINFNKPPKYSKHKDRKKRNVIRIEFENGDYIEIEDDLVKVA